MRSVAFYTLYKVSHIYPPFPPYTTKDWSNALDIALLLDPYTFNAAILDGEKKVKDRILVLLSGFLNEVSHTIGVTLKFST